MLKFLSIEPVEVISHSVYNCETSLKEDIDILCNPKILVDDDIIINIVVKYFYAYRYPESVFEKVNLKKIEELFWIWNYFFSLVNKKQKDVIWYANLINELKYFQDNVYGLAMLWDIASTSKIFWHIVKQKINRSEKNNYFWLDMWTWTGILLLAQKIQAKRNFFAEKEIENIWIEIQKNQADRANVLANTLDFWRVIVWDTTKSNTFKNIINNKSISYITNETIPNPWISMDWENDPFFQNFQNMYKNYWLYIDKATKMFPSNLIVNIKIINDSWKILIDEKFCANRRNNYLVNFFSKMEEEIWNEWVNIFDYVKPVGFLWEGRKILRLEEVWNELINLLKVKKVPENWQKRRFDVTSPNPAS